MSTLSKLRCWANRDDGRLFRVSNEDISLLSLLGVIVLVGALVVRQIELVGDSSAELAALMATTGVALLVVGVRTVSRSLEAPEQFRPDT